MEIVIRGERVSDYHEIAVITALAFQNENYIGEVSLIDTLRRSVHFDPDLSLVALYNDEIIGHILFYPNRSILNGKEIPSVLLGPICVKPGYQKMGVGGQLIQKGHQIAKEKGYQFSFLWGHSSYYPQFGYLTKMFGESKIVLERNQFHTNTKQIEEKVVKEEHINDLMDMWVKWFNQVDLSIRPDHSLHEWISQYGNIRSKVIFIDNELKGYIRYDESNKDKLKMFLSKDKQSTIDILHYIDETTNHNEPITIPIHEDSSAYEYFKGLKYKYELSVYEAFMLKVLNEQNMNLSTYCEEVQFNKRSVGSIILPPAYEMD